MNTKTSFRYILLLLVLDARAEIRSTYAQGQSSATPISESAEVLNFHPTEHPNPFNPRVAFAALNDAKEGYIAQLRLFAVESEYEKALEKGERPQVPANYTSSRSRLTEVRRAAMRLIGCTRFMEKVLSVPENARLDPQTRKMMEKTIAELPSTENIGVAEK